MSAALLSVQGLRAGFGANTVLHGVDFSVAPGEIVTLLGLNGAGKSVTMKVVGGLVPAWAGTVTLAGEDVTRLSVEDRVARGIGHVPQGRQLFPELTVEENLRLGGYLLRRRQRPQYDIALDRLYTQFPRLAERRTQLAGTMSGGEQAMLAVARALVSEPKLLLVDEPSAGLSPAVADVLFALLAEVNAAGLTILLVEQNVRMALRIAGRALVMQRGRVVHAAPVAELDGDVLASHLGIGRLLSASTSTATTATTATRRRRTTPLRARP
jgi:branched-chain amino acid transport system ATP-binding protein